jgi:CubicO group peptidase (beta-lactamase class C family)
MRVAILAAVVALATPAWSQSAGASDPRCQAALAYSAAHRGAAVLVLKDGQPICEGYAGEGAADHAMELYSGTKSFVGLMLAAAVQDRLLTLDEPVAATLPEWSPDPLKARVTIRELLALTSGLPSEIGQVPTYAAAVGMPFNAGPGERFQYGPGPYQVFGEVMRRKLAAAGQPSDPYAYLKRRILDPIGLRPADWRRLPNGDALLPQGAVLTVREWVKVGEFVRAGGVVGGRRIVDEAAFHALFQGSKTNPAYGITWWLPNPTASPDPVTASNDLARRSAEVPRDLVMAAGAADQRLYVIPSKRLTIARLASFPPGALVAERAARARGEGWSDTRFVRFFTD